MAYCECMNTFLKACAWISNLILWIICLIPISLKFPSPITRADLFYHALSYTLVGSAFLLAYPLRPKWILSLLIIQGIAIEYIQPLTGRFFEFYDMIANATGVLFSYLLWILVLQKLKLSLFKKFNFSR